MRDLLTDVLDVLGLLAVAVGLGMAAAAVWLPLGPMVGGLVLLAELEIAARSDVLLGMLRRRGGRP